MKFIINSISLWIGAVVTFFVLGWAIETGKNMSAKTKKVCDLCFRDIKLVNKMYKK